MVFVSPATASPLAETFALSASVSATNLTMIVVASRGVAAGAGAAAHAAATARPRVERRLPYPLPLPSVNALLTIEVADHEAADQEAADHEALDQEAADHEALDQEAADHEAADQEAADQEAADQEAADQEALVPLVPGFMPALTASSQLSPSKSAGPPFGSPTRNGLRPWFGFGGVPFRSIAAFRSSWPMPSKDEPNQ